MCCAVDEDPEWEMDPETRRERRRLRKIAYRGGFPRLYHRTSKDLAAKILVEGFRDGENGHPVFTGVWLSNAPLDESEGARGDTVMIVHFRVSLRRLSQFEVVEEGKVHREWVVPAAFIAKHATITLSQHYSAPWQ